MKNQNYKISISRTYADAMKGNLKSNLSKPSPMISPLKAKAFMEMFQIYGFRLISLSLYSVSSKIHSRVKLFHNFGNFLLVMTKRNGITYTVKYLKACQLAIQKKIAGQPLESLRELEPDLPLPRLTKSGLPRFIQLRDRRAISSGSLSVIRMWLTMFAVYRVIKIPIVPKLSTITNPFSGDPQYLREFERIIPRGMSKFRNFVKFDRRCGVGLGKQTSLLPILKAGGGYHVSLGKLLVLPKTFHDSGLWESLLRFVDLSGNQLLKSQLIRLNNLHSLAMTAFGGSTGVSETLLGKLSFKEEAAGKLRVFAIVDCVTQSALFGLHQWLFDVLRRIPNDGTFNQEAAFSRAQDKAKLSGCSFGYDLSAATDRLPISLQVTILSYWFGDEFAKLWHELLVNRDYIVVPASEKASEWRKSIVPGPYRYAVGQPMGAYSSWAMLAVTHHFIVQWAHHLAYPRASLREWFTGYELLGDDIVIFDRLVAAKYREIMLALGVEINLSKSVVSNPGSVVEFAKRTSFKGVDVSAISIKMLQAALDAKSKVQVAMYLSMKTGRMMSNHLKALFSLGPSHLYKMENLPPVVRKAESSVIMQMLKTDWSNFSQLMASSIDVSSSGMDAWEDMILFGDKMKLSPATSTRVATALIKQEPLLLKPTDTQFSFYWDMQHWLKPLLIERYRKRMSSVYHAFFYDSIYIVDTLMAPWYETLDEQLTFSQSQLDQYYIDEIDKQYHESFREFRDELYSFVWDIWIHPELDRTYGEILEFTGLTRLEVEKDLRGRGDITHVYERFSGALADPYYYKDMEVEQMFYLLSKVESLLSIPRRFKYGYGKLIGADSPLPKGDPMDFSIGMINDINKMIHKAHRAGKVGRSSSFNIQW